MEKVKNREQFLEKFKETWSSIQINPTFENKLKGHHFFQQHMTNIEVRI
jgi:restriction endonuclease